MSILEDLDLLDLNEELLDETEFNLDDILFEFSTPGLFVAPVKAEAEIPASPELSEITEEAPAAEAEEAPAAAPEQPSSELPEIPVLLPEAAEEEEKEEEDDYHGDLFGNPFGLGDILYEFGSPTDDDGVKVYNPAAKAQPAEDEDDIKVYVPPIKEAEAAQPVAETIPFAAVAEAEAEAEPAAQPRPKEKGPSLLTKAVGLVMGLFSRKKEAPKHLAKHGDSAPEVDHFADAARLFEEDAAANTDMDIDSALMLELELLAEMAEEKAAMQEADEAEERIVSTPAPVVEVPEAILEAQLEAEEAAAAALAQAEAAANEEAELLAEAEDELLDWIESGKKYRGKAVSLAELNPFTEEEEASNEGSETIYEDIQNAVQMQMQDIAEAEAAVGTEDTAEESSAELLSLLENPDIEPENKTASPVAEAEQKAKEDDELHYKPDAPMHKAVADRISKRFGAAFSVFSETADGEDEEALGPEISPVKAYRFFSQFVNGYRFRLRLSAVLSVVLAWISLGLPVFGSMRNSAVAAAMCLMLQLTIMLAGADIIGMGFGSLLRKRPGLNAMVVLSCFASIIDACVIIASKGQLGYLPFCAVSAISMTFAIYGSLLYCRGHRLGFKVVAEVEEPLTISVEHGVMDEDTTTVYRTFGHPEEFIHRSEEEDLSESVYGFIAPIIMVAIPLLALLAALISKGMGDFFHILAAMFGAAASFSAFVAFPLPYFLVQSNLFRSKSAIAGWSGTKDIGRVSTMIISDSDLFPDETVSIKSVGIVDGVSSDLTLSYFCSMMREARSCLSPAFEQLAENHNCQYREVTNFQCHETGGLSGTIGPDEVLIACHSYMKLQGYRLPVRKKDSENALFMAANGHVIACIIMEYKPIKSVHAGLQSALRGNVELIFAARDFNVTPLLISKMFRSETDSVLFPSYKQRFEITDHTHSDNAASAAVVSRKSLISYAAVVEKARYLYRSVSLSVALSVVSGAMGVLLMFIMALTGAGAAVTVSRLLIFMLLWLVPTLALTVSITK